MKIAAQRELTALLDAQVAAHLGVLADLGYGTPALANTESSVLPAVRATLIAPTRELWMDVAFPATDPRALKRHVMTVFLFRRGGEPEGSLYVDWFAAMHRPDLDGALEQHAQGGGSLADFVRSAVPLYGTLFNEDLRPILAGESWEGGNGDPAVARAFGFLVREHGFSNPVGRTHLHEQTHVYSRGDVTVRIDCLGGPASLTIQVGDKAHGGWRIPFATAADLLKAHPEVLSGNFDAIREWERSANRAR